MTGLTANRIVFCQAIVYPQLKVSLVLLAAHTKWSLSAQQTVPCISLFSFDLVWLLYNLILPSVWHLGQASSSRTQRRRRRHNLCPLGAQWNNISKGRVLSEGRNFVVFEQYQARSWTGHCALHRLLHSNPPGLWHRQSSITGYRSEKRGLEKVCKLPRVTVSTVTMSRPHSGVYTHHENNNRCTSVADAPSDGHRSQEMLGLLDRNINLQGVRADEYGRHSPLRSLRTESCSPQILMLKP